MNILTKQPHRFTLRIAGFIDMDILTKRLYKFILGIVLITAGFILTTAEANAINNNVRPYKPRRNSSMANKQFAPAYRMRETPHYALKTNLLSDLTTSMNLGAEFRIWRKMTIDVPLTLNPWMYNKEENTKFKFFLFQPELRYWDCEAFNGHFLGIHGHYSYYNVGHMPSSPFSETMNTYRFEGKLAGAGVSYGYHWFISPRWSFEAEIGAGYARLQYDKFPCQNCAKLLSRESKNYWGVTRVGLNLIYVF